MTERMTRCRRHSTAIERTLAVVALLALALAVSTTPGVRAQTGDQNDPRSVPVKTLDEAIKSGRIARESVAAARANGLVPIIIRLNLPTRFQPEGGLTNPQVEGQRQAIAATQRAILDKLAGRRFTDVKQYGTIPWLAMWAGTDALTTLVAHPAVYLINVDTINKPLLGTSVPQVGGDIVRLALGNPGAGQTVAILDTGVDGTNPALAGKIVSEACFSTSMPFISGNVCPNGDSTAAGSGVPCNVGLCWHGTHVAGIAVANDGATLFGVAPAANLIAIQVFSDFGGTARAYDSDVLQGLERVYALRGTFNIAAVNLSLGADFYANQAGCDDSNQDVKDIVDNLRGAGIATVAGSGNSASPFQLGLAAPACVSSVISVGATMGTGSGETIGIWTFAGGGTGASQTAPFLDLLAPGTITFPSSPATAGTPQVGTSFAAPHVAGAIAVLRGQNPGRSVAEELSALTSAGFMITDTRPTPAIVTPRLRLVPAVESFTQRPLPATNLQVVSFTGTNITVSWTNNSGVANSFRLTATPPQGSLLPTRGITVSGNQTVATVGTETASDGTVLKLQPNTVYTLKVRACGAGGLCSDSQSISQRTANTLPALPTNLRGTNASSSGVTLVWDYTGAQPVTYFRLVRYVCGTGYDCNSATPAMQLGGSVRSFVVSGLTGNWQVRWRLQACNDDGCNPTWVNGPNISTPNPGLAPAAPTNLHVCGQGGDPLELCQANRVTLIWNDNANNEDTYEFQWTIAQQGVPPWNATWNTEVRGANARSYAFTTWSSGLLYYFRVRACNPYGCSSWSNMVSYTMP